MLEKTRASCLIIRMQEILTKRTVVIFEFVHSHQCISSALL